MRIPANISEASRAGHALVHRKHKRSQQHYGPDTAPVDEVFAVLAGEVECLIAGDWKPMRAGELLCVRRGRTWGVRPSRSHAGEVRLLSIEFACKPSWCEGAPLEPTPLPGPWLRQLLHLEAQAGFDARGQRVLPLPAVVEFVNAFLRASNGVNRRGVGPSRADTASDWMSTWIAAEDVIRSRAPAGLSAATLAQAVHCSPTHLRRIYLSVRGVSPKAAIIEWRIAEAKRLLSTGGWSATQVAAKVGFTTVQHFHAAFRKVVGITPGKYGKTNG
jgi:AraC-like DNA-binding protein